MERITIHPIWVRFPTLPVEFWCEGILKKIGNCLGDFTVFFRISCVTHWLTLWLKYWSTWIYHQGFHKPWIWRLMSEFLLQTLDYDAIPSQCNLCHRHGHPNNKCPFAKCSKRVSKKKASLMR
jgi:hypothetical protein